MAHGLSGFAGGAVAAAELWCEYAVDPLGIDVAEPRFSWILGSERRGQVQSAYRILVASSADLLRGGVGDKWDSGVVASEASVNVPYAGAALASGERCFWQVWVWDGDGAGSAWSDPACFEMGLLDRGYWGGSWIGAEGDQGDLADLAAPLLRKEFTIEEPVGEARLYLCGLGLYELSINGARVGDVTWARASIKTVRGTVASNWQLAADSLAVQVEIPVNSRATIAIPKLGRPAVSVSEQGVELVRNGELTGTIAGLLGASENSGQVELRVGSGSYSFLLTGC